MITMKVKTIRSARTTIITMVPASVDGSGTDGEGRTKLVGPVQNIDTHK